jgi:transposase
MDLTLTNKQWDIGKTILPPDPVREDGRSRPWKDQCTALNGILWILRTGAPWAAFLTEFQRHRKGGVG